MKFKIKRLIKSMTETPQSKKRSQKNLGYVKHIPGGKRFWKIGNLYQLIKKTQLSFQDYGLAEVSPREHNLFNNRWRDKQANTPFVNLNKNYIVLEPGSVVMLIGKPNYKTIIKTNNFSYYGVFHTPLIDSYQIKVFYENKIGWILVNKNISPKTLFKPVK